MKKLILIISFLLLTTFAFAKVYVGVVDKVMKTDANGVVGWRDDASGGSPAWGSITGTLSAQTDLSGALDGKAASLGADDNYVTDAEKIVIGNTSGANTGDNTVATTGDSATAFFSSGTFDGDLLPAMSTTKKGGVPATATPSGKYLKDDGTFATPGGGDDARLIMDALDTGEQHDVTASTALTEVTQLSQTLAAGTYTFRYYVIYRSNQLTNGIRLAVNYTGTNGAFVWWWRWSDLSALASTAVPDQDNIGAAGHVMGSLASRAKSTTTRGTTLSVDTINADMFIIIEGVFVATGAGDLELWHGSEVNTAAYTTSVMIGTSVEIHKTK